MIYDNLPLPVMGTSGNLGITVLEYTYLVLVALFFILAVIAIDKYERGRKLGKV
jgi:hypothetical protein